VPVSFWLGSLPGPLATAVSGVLREESWRARQGAHPIHIEPKRLGIQVE
jgi:hypothetical protein